MFSLQLLQGPRPAVVNSTAVTSSSSQMVSQPTPMSLKGVTSGYQSSVEHNACHIKSVFMPGSSPYDLPSISTGDGGDQTESHPLIGDSMDNVGDKQVLLEVK